MLSILGSVLSWQWVYPIGPCVLIGGPKCSYPSEVKVYLYTRSNPSEPQYVAHNDTYDNITESQFIPARGNKMIIHGYNADMFLGPLVDIKTAYLTKHDYNVWAVDWSPLCRGPCYPFAMFNIIQVGRCVADFIRRLQQHADSPLQLHIVAFSLGAHVSNYVANSLEDYKIPRITGLDPALPGFITRNGLRKLDPTDANFVDVVHTNGLAQGQIERCGHVDFYMNGGFSQPGCLRESNPLGCDHHRAPQYFAESITTTVGFLGWKCRGFIDYLLGLCMPKTELVPMGEYCDESARGFHIVYTADEKPFALGMWARNHHKLRFPKLVSNETNMNTTAPEVLNDLTVDLVL